MLWLEVNVFPYVAADIAAIFHVAQHSYFSISVPVAAALSRPTRLTLRVPTVFTPLLLYISVRPLLPNLEPHFHDYRLHMHVTLESTSPTSPQGRSPIVCTQVARIEVRPTISLDEGKNACLHHEHCLLGRVLSSPFLSLDVMGRWIESAENDVKLLATCYFQLQRIIFQTVIMSTAGDIFA